MTETIYLVDPVTKGTQPFTAISFSELGIRERTDLQEWVLRHPQMLGEELFIITSEFSRLDKSNKRLDILALDLDGKLVIVELKLDAHDSLAELQAIRYAAFCSTMTMEDAISARAKFCDETDEESANAMRGFLGVDTLPELDNKPRVLIAAGTINDQELTATVLWLRSFGLDIGCVELTPYKLTEPERFVLVPRVIIPLPEAKQYLIDVERKEAAKKHSTVSSSFDNSDLWQAVASAFNTIAPAGFSATRKSRGWYMQVRNAYAFAPHLGGHDIHFEWLYKSSDSLIVALHFETKNPAENRRICREVMTHSAMMSEDITYPFAQGDWAGKWRDIRFVVTHSTDEPVTDTAGRVARLMKTFIERATPIIQKSVANTSNIPSDFQQR